MSGLQQNSEMADLLLELERELRRLQMWEEVLPPAADLLSTEPFACDVMSLHQWLQWIFIPRIKVLVEQGDVLPGNCSIAPYAEQVFPELEADTTQLQALIVRIDTLLS